MSGDPSDLLPFPLPTRPYIEGRELTLRLMSETIQDRVLRVIATTKRIPLESVRPESTFEELGVDSLDRLNILFDLESEFDVEINDEDAKKVSNIDEMVAGITLLLDAKENPALPGQVAAPVTPPHAAAAEPASHAPATTPRVTSGDDQS